MSDKLSESIKWLEHLITFDTTSRLSNIELIKSITNYLKSIGVETRLTYNSKETKANLWCTIGPSDIGGIVLSGHTDVVPIDGQAWTKPPFKMSKENGKLYGRGTSDMKGFCAIVLAMAPEMKKRTLKTPIHFAFSYDEEVGCVGVRGLIKDVVENLPLPRAVIVGEPTSMKIVGGNKGGRAFRTTVRGVPGHSSEPSRGANSIMAAARIINYIESLQNELAKVANRKSLFDPPFTTFDLGVIEGGTANNIIPEYTHFNWGYRSLPDENPEHLEQKIRTFITEVIEPQLQVNSTQACVITELKNATPPLIPDHQSAAEHLIRHLTGLNESGTVAFGTEAGLFQQAGIPGVIFGPGSIQQAHQPDEFIEISQMAECVTFLHKLIDWAETNS
jgi:acetylornithine deacetylase